MTDHTTAPSLRSHIGFALCRLLVPLWVATGAIFKLIEQTPSLLPEKTIRDVAHRLDLDLFMVLAVLISLELFAVAVMLFVRHAARPMALFVLSVFCMILIGEMAMGNVTSCGCLGSFSPPPWLMLAIDGGLLLGVALFPMARVGTGRRSRRGPVLAALLAIAGAAASFGVLIPAGRAPQEQTSNGETGSANPRVNPAVKALEGYWYSTDDTRAEWIGKSWKDIDIFQHMSLWPSDMDAPVKYVVFFSRTCEHCEEMFRNDLAGNDALAAQVTAIEIPDSKTDLRSPQAWPMPPNACEMMELPLGCDWIIEAPLALRIENGIIQCASEGEHKDCLQIE